MESHEISKILIAEDEELLREIWIEELKLLNVEVFEARNGAEAVEILKKNEIDILITDIKMPVKDGYHILNYIKENNLKDIITFVSSGYYDEAKNQISDYKIEAIFQKPFDLNSCLETVQKFLK